MRSTNKLANLACIYPMWLISYVYGFIMDVYFICERTSLAYAASFALTVLTVFYGNSVLEALACLI